VLVKLSPQNYLNSFKGTVILEYNTPKGEHQRQEYPVEYNFPQHEQFFSEKCLQEAISVYYFVHEMKALVSDINSSEGESDKQAKEKQVTSLKELKKIAPESKHKDIDGMIEILQR